ncbi:MAG TPA: hypothetical protein VJJ82_04865 [Candidatus Nanoarchaeia archaeon]|nr:hypothetical protein [Candidatus Nanoarchaeia archaeon]
MKGQVTIFIIIGIVFLVAVGFAIYFMNRSSSLISPVGKLPQKVQPVQDAVAECIRQISVDGLQKIGQTGGYIDASSLSAHLLFSTEGNAVRFSPRSELAVASWWYMKSKDSCTENCEFASKRPSLKEGSQSIAGQLTTFVNDNLPSCVASITVPGCAISSVSDPALHTEAGQSVVVSGEYPLRVICDGQSFEVSQFVSEIDVNLADIYELATNITNLQIHEHILEQATTTILQTFAGKNADIPPFRDLEFGPPGAGHYWVKYEVLKNVKRLLTSYIPFIQVLGTANYNYIRAPQGVRDPELYELIYNRQFLIPLNKSYPLLETSFRYLDWWEPYFDLNCNGQLCQADTGSNFFLIPFSINRYEFAYDLSYPVLVEIRNPYALQGKGYTFQFFLEQNMRNSAPFVTGISLPFAQTTSEPSIFCSPDQRTSGDVQIYVTDAESRRGADNVSLSFQCGDDNCNFGRTVNGTIITRFPRCIGGHLELNKPEYESRSVALDTFMEKPQNVSIALEPIRTVSVTVKNYEIKKESKNAGWEFEQAAGLTRHKHGQETLVLMTRKDGQFTAFASIQSQAPAEMRITPGQYHISVISLLHQNLTIPPDERCVRVKKIMTSEKECSMVPENAIRFNETSPFPYGIAEFDYLFTSDMLKGARNIEFREFVLSIDAVEERNRVIEDLGEASKLQGYVDQNPSLVWPVVSR